MLLVVASSPAIVNVSVADTVASIPSPLVIVNVLPSAIDCVVEPSLQVKALEPSAPD